MNLSPWNTEPNWKAIADSQTSQRHCTAPSSRAQPLSRTCWDCLA
jgi:hypothetical protein